MDKRRTGTLSVALLASAATGMAQVAEKVTPISGASGDSFGYAVDVDGDWMVCGAFRDDSVSTDGGAAQVLHRDANGWTFAQELLPQSAIPSGYAGYAVALAGDVIALGAPGPVWSGNVLGIVHVFEFDGVQWNQTARLENPTGEIDDQFGRAVALSGDRLLVGAPHDDATGADAGRAWVYERGPSGWELAGSLTAPDAWPGDYFGFSVAIDGERALVSCPYDDDRGTNAGAAWMFEREAGGWAAVTKLVSADSHAFDAFGTSVALHRDRAIVGAPSRDAGGPNRGAAYVFERWGSTWVEEHRLTASDGADEDAFGISVDLWGLQAVVGASNADRTFANAGAAYRFLVTGGAWVEDGQIVAADPRAYAYLGLDVAATWDEAVAGAFLAVDELGHVTGATYVGAHEVPWWETFCACTDGGACGGVQGDAGCTNSSGRGAVLRPTGTPSLALWELGFTLEQASKKDHAYLLAGPVSPAAPLGAGYLCVGLQKGQLTKLQQIYLGKTSKEGTLTIGAQATALVSQGVFTGDSLGFQVLYRDPGGKCGGGWNASDAVAVTILP